MADKYRIVTSIPAGRYKPTFKVYRNNECVGFRMTKDDAEVYIEELQERERTA